MIRLPPSSISLSERDIDFHLQQAHLYHGLLKQGFKKDDIIRYLSDYREATGQAYSGDALGLNLPSASTFELSASRLHSPEPSESGPAEPQRRHSISSASASSPSTPFPDLPLDFVATEDFNNLKTEDVDSAAPVLTTPNNLVNQHAPRKSSLLRFAHAISPEHSSPKPEDEGDNLADMLAPRSRKYKRRSNTYPYQSSDRDSAGEPHNDLADAISQMSLRNNPTDDSGADDLPFALPKPCPAVARVETRVGPSFASPPFEGSSVTPPTIPRRSSSLLGYTDYTTDIPSSPPLPSTPMRHHLSQPQTSADSPELPTTPTPIRNALRTPRTEPRRYRQQLDGNAFSVYNDSVSATSQPQTPADLSRQPFITEYDAAYTAPPGMTGAGRVSAPYRDRHGWERESGEQTPTARAISLRDRRNRELTRSIRAEGVRLHRLRLRDEALFTELGAQAAAAANGGGRRETVPPMGNDIWRDDLEADRVGEENFEAETDVSRPSVMRAVSGNARFDT